MASIESDISSEAGSCSMDISDSGSDGYQGDSEAVPRRSALRPRSATKVSNRTSRALSPGTLESLSKARARRRSARQQHEEKQRTTRQEPSRSPPRYYRYSSSPEPSGSPASSAQYFRGPRTPSPFPTRAPFPPSSIERLPADITRRILPRMHIPSRDGLAVLRDALSIAQHVFYDAVQESWPPWTHATFPQGAHEVSFSLLDLDRYFVGYSVGDGELALRDASSCDVFHAVRDVSWLRNRTYHFPPRSHVDYQKTAPSAVTATTRKGGGSGDMRAALMEGFSWPFAPDCAGWYWEATSPAWWLARLLDDRAALAAVERLNDRVEDGAWAMLRRIEEIAAVGGDDGPWDEDMKARGKVVRATMRAVPEALCVPLDMFFLTVRQSDNSWPLMIRQAARVWEWTNAEAE